jgi:hypothetical protein
MAPARGGGGSGMGIGDFASRSRLARSDSNRKGNGSLVAGLSFCRPVQFRALPMHLFWLSPLTYFANSGKKLMYFALNVPQKIIYICTKKLGKPNPSDKNKKKKRPPPLL